MIAIVVSSIGSLGSGWITLVQLVLSWTAFWASTWEEYHTGTLYLGFISGPEEGLTSLMIFFMITYFTGNYILLFVSTPF